MKLHMLEYETTYIYYIILICIYIYIYCFGDIHISLKPVLVTDTPPFLSDEPHPVSDKTLPVSDKAPLVSDSIPHMTRARTPPIHRQKGTSRTREDDCREKNLFVGDENWFFGDAEN